MNKYLKYLLSLFLTFVVIANDCTLDFQSKSADYYQSSYLIARREVDFESSRLYKFAQSTSRTKAVFSIVLQYLSNKDVFTFQIRVIQNMQIFLHQKINSFIKQSVFVNEIITSNNFKTSLYIA